LLPFLVRYLIHLLPEEGQRREFDALRARVAAAIGQNKALDYPTAHVTLVWSIQDDPGDAAPIDGAALAALLDEHRGSGLIPLTARAGIEEIEHHLLLPLNDSPALAAVRGRIFAGARAIAGAPDGRAAERVGRVREQTWPHLTLAQEIDDEAWRRGLEIVRAAGDWVWRPVIGAELALLARDIDAGQPYRIVHRAPLG
jgi:hypothetical protein